MQRLLLALCLCCCTGLLSAAAAAAAPVELITNGGFETGSFVGWTPSTTIGTPYCSTWIINACNFGAPTEGSSAAWNGFDGSGPGVYRLDQTVTIPAGPATLTWDDYAWASLLFATLPRTAEVQIRDASGVTVLATPHSFTAPAGTLTDTGWVSHSVDVSAFAGQTVQITFLQTIPENFSGPGGYGLDNVHLVANTLTEGAHAGYCSVTGNTWLNGSSIKPGTFLDLFIGQPATDPHYTGATPAIFVQGKGITCDPPPSGYRVNGHAGDEQSMPRDIYQLFVPA
jgi:hypothetical protein